jgi:secretory lipase
MLGYSGGAIGTEWAAELAPTYAPDVNGRMIGAAMGGVLVDPAHNLNYVEGTYFWSGVMPMALVGIARAFEVDFRPYLSAYGVKAYHDMQTASIVNVLGRYWGLKWTDLVGPAYPTPESLPLYVTLANKLIMGTGGTPTIPLFIGQGANGDLEWTPGGKKGIGSGNGVMIAGDVRTLAPRLLR